MGKLIITDDSEIIKPDDASVTSDSEIIKPDDTEVTSVEVPEKYTEAEILDALTSMDKVKYLDEKPNTSSLGDKLVPDIDPDVFTDYMGIPYKIAIGTPNWIENFLVRPSVKALLDKETFEAYEEKQKQTLQWLSKLNLKYGFGLHKLDDAQIKAITDTVHVNPENGELRYAQTGEGILTEVGGMFMGGSALYHFIARRFPKLVKTQKGKAAAIAMAEQVMEGSYADPNYTLGNLLEDFVTDNPVVGWFASDEADPIYLKRAKQMLSLPATGVAVRAFQGTLALGKKITEPLSAIYERAGFNIDYISNKARELYGKALNSLNIEESEEFAERILYGARKEEVAKANSSLPNLNPIRAKGEETAEDVAEIVRQASTKDLAKGWLGNLAENIFSRGFFTRIRKRFFTRRGWMTDEPHNLKQQSIRRTRAYVNHADQIARRLENYIEDAVTTYDGELIPKVTKALEEDLSNIDPEKHLDHLINNMQLPKDVAEEVLNSRELLDELSQIVLDNNIGTEIFRKAVSQNLGTWIRRSYKKYVEGNFKPSKAGTKAGEDFFREQALLGRIEGLDIEDYSADIKMYYEGDEIPDVIPESVWRQIVPEEVMEKAGRVAKNKLHEFLGEDVKGFDDFINNLHKINKNLFKERKNLDPRLRELMGEIPNPAYNVRSSAMKLIQMIETNNYYTQLAKQVAEAPSDTNLWNSSINKARDEMSDIDLLKFTEEFDITPKDGTFITFKENGKDILGRYRGLTRDEKIKIEVKNSLGEVEIKKLSQDTTLNNVTADDVLEKMASDMYTDFGGVFTPSKYIFRADEIPKDANGVPLDPEHKKFTHTITGTNSILDGRVTTKQVAETLSGIEDTNKFMRLIFSNKSVNVWRGVKGLSQANKTVWDHTTQFRNNFGGINMSLTNGINPLKNGRVALGISKNHIFKMDNKTWNALYTQLQSLGILNTSVRANEWISLLKQSDDMSVETFSQQLIRMASEGTQEYTSAWGGVTKKFDKKTRSALEIPGKVYMEVDNFYKINGFFHELETLKKAMPDAAQEELVELAAEKIRRTFPNYDVVPHGLKAVAELPFGNFVAFTPEMIRSQANIGMVAIEEIFSGNKILFSRGMKRLGSFAGVSAAWASSGYGAAELAGFTDRQKDGIQVMAETPWSKRKDKIPVVMDGKLFVIDRKYMDPYDHYPAMYQNMLVEIENGTLTAEDAKSQIARGTIKALAGLTSFVTDQAMVADVTTNVLYASLNDKGRGPDNQKIFTNKEDMGVIVQDFLKYAGQSLAPGWMIDSKKVWDAATQKPHKLHGKPLDLKAIMVEMSTGFLLKEVDPELVLMNATMGYVAEKSFKFGKALEEFGGDVEGWANEQMKLESKKFRATQHYYRTLNALKDFGWHKKDIVDIAVKKYNLISEDAITEMLKGKYQPTGVGPILKKRIERKYAHDEVKLNEVLSNLEFFKDQIEGTSLYSAPVRSEETQRLRSISQSRIPFSNFFGIGKKANYETLKQYRKDNRDYKKRFFEGGIVNVPYTKDNSADRVNPFTGRPYTDEFKDPLRRLGFNNGGKILNSLRQRKQFGGIAKWIKFAKVAAEEIPTTRPKTTNWEQLNVTQKDVDEFQAMKKETKDPEKEKLRKIEEEISEVAAKRLSDETIPMEQRIEEFKKAAPVRERTQEEVNLIADNLPTDRDVAMSIGKKSNKEDIKILGFNDTLKTGDEIEFRVDIPAFRDYDVWTLTAHKPVKGKSVGKPIAYGKTGHLKNVTFKSEFPESTYNIAIGKQDKFPMATIKGEWIEHSPEELAQRLKTLPSDPEWMELGFNPKKSSKFYDKKDKKVVESADELIQVGGVVFGKNVKLSDIPPSFFKKSDSAIGKFKTTEKQQEFLEGFKNADGNKEFDYPIRTSHGRSMEVSINQRAKLENMLEQIKDSGSDKPYKWSQLYIEGPVSPHGNTLRIVHSPKNMKDITKTDVVYHQTTLDSIRKLLPTLSRNKRDIKLYASPEIDLALGQRKASNYILELDTEKVIGSYPNSKQNIAHAELNEGDIAEVIVERSLKNPIKAIILKNKKDIENLKRAAPKNKFTGAQQKNINAAINKFDFNNVEEVEIQSLQIQNLDLRAKNISDLPLTGSYFRIPVKSISKKDQLIPFSSGGILSTLKNNTSKFEHRIAS